MSASTTSEATMRNGRITGFRFLPAVKLCLAVQASQDELEKRVGKMFTDPSKKTLRVVLIDFFRDHQFVQKDARLSFRQALFFDPHVINSAAHFVCQF